MTGERRPRLGRARGGAGLFLIFCAAVFFFAVFQAGLLEPFLRQTSTLRVLLPESGLAGLGPGAQVRLFGSPVGEVTRVVIRPDEPFYAETQVDDTMLDFIRQDSRVFIRLQFGVAGAAFLDITRGTGAELDWDFAVLQAELEQAPTEGIGALIDEARERIFPLVEEATRTVRLAGEVIETLLEPDSALWSMLARFDELSAGIAAGEGTLGRLLQDETLVLGLETAVVQLNQQVAALAPLLADLGQAGGTAVRIAENVADGTEELPTLVNQLQTTLRAVDILLGETATAMPAFEDAALNAGDSLEALPEVLRRTGQTLAQLEDLLDTLRRSWLIGGGGTATGEPLTPSDVRP